MPSRDRGSRPGAQRPTRMLAVRVERFAHARGTATVLCEPHSGDEVGNARQRRKDERSDHDIGHVPAIRQRLRGRHHSVGAAHHGRRRRRDDNRIPTPRGSLVLVSPCIALLLHDRLAQDQRKALTRPQVQRRECDVRREREKHQHETHRAGKDIDGHERANRRHGDRHASRRTRPWTWMRTGPAINADTPSSAAMLKTLEPTTTPTPVSS